MISFLRQSLKEGYPFTSHLHIFLRTPTCTSNCCFYCLLSGLSGHLLPLITSICLPLHPSIHLFILPILPFGSWMVQPNLKDLSCLMLSLFAAVKACIWSYYLGMCYFITIKTLVCRMLITKVKYLCVLNLTT